MLRKSIECLEGLALEFGFYSLLRAESLGKKMITENAGLEICFSVPGKKVNERVFQVLIQGVTDGRRELQAHPGRQ